MQKQKYYILAFSVIVILIILMNGCVQQQPPKLDCGNTMQSSLNAVANGNKQCVDIYYALAGKCVDKTLDLINNQVLPQYFRVEKLPFQTPYINCLLNGNNPCSGYDIVFKYSYFGSQGQKQSEELGTLQNIWCDTNNQNYKPRITIATNNNLVVSDSCVNFIGATYDKINNKCDFRGD